VTVITNSPLGVNSGDTVTIGGLPGYNGTFTVTATHITNPFFPPTSPSVLQSATGLGEVTSHRAAPPRFPAHRRPVDARQIMDIGVMNGISRRR